MSIIVILKKYSCTAQLLTYAVYRGYIILTSCVGHIIILGYKIDATTIFVYWYRCLKSHGISVLTKPDLVVKSKKKFKQCLIGYFHIDIAEGKLYLFVAIDRTSKFCYAELHTGSNQNYCNRIFT
jgi:hypothetical protein